MKTATRLTALAGATALVAVPLTFAAMAPASADVDRRGACGTGVFEFSVDKERTGYEIDASVDGVTPGSQWTFVVRHDGKRLSKVTRTADNEGEVDVDAFARNTAGRDRFSFVAKNGTTTCGTSITVA